MSVRKAVERGPYHFSKTINAPLTYVFDWCTDFREDDSKLTGSKSVRKILRENKKRIVYVNEERMSGKTKEDVSIVSLFPPDAWHLDAVGDDLDELGDYKLTRLAEKRTRLDMTFYMKYKAGIKRIPTKAESSKETYEFWDKLIKALENDYNKAT